jgi:hypothetical protein
LIFVSLHGLIHLLGFVKAFGLSEVKALTQAISKPFGTIWLLAAVFMLLTAVLFALQYNYLWLVRFFALAISQILIIFFWQDAKFGTIANGIILIGAIIGYGTSSFQNKYQNEVKTGLQQCAYFQNSAMTETDIHDLPEPVKKYLQYYGIFKLIRVEYNCKEMN